LPTSLATYDLERLPALPELLVLSACDSALSAVRPGDELMGLASALFGLGTATLVGSVVPVPDAESRALMTAFHRHLVAGCRPAVALPRARADIGGGAGFVCFGRG
jgi:CHAT domain-containing protein